MVVSSEDDYQFVTIDNQKWSSHPKNLRVEMRRTEITEYRPNSPRLFLNDAPSKMLWIMPPQNKQAALSSFTWPRRPLRKLAKRRTVACSTLPFDCPKVFEVRVLAPAKVAAELLQSLQRVRSDFENTHRTAITQARNSIFSHSETGSLNLLDTKEVARLKREKKIEFWIRNSEQEI